MCLCGLRFKKHIIFHILYIIVAPLCSAFLKHIDIYKAHCSERRGVLWLASYPVHCDWPNTSSVWRKCYALHCFDETKTIKPIINEAFVASSGDIITDYNDLYCLFTLKHYHVCICDRRNDKQQALLYTAQNSRLNSQWQKNVIRKVLTGCESEASDCPCKVGIAPLYRNSLCAQLAL